MNAVENQVRELVAVEIAAANERFPLSHPAPGGGPVILEEVDEPEAEMKTISGNVNGMFYLIRNNVDAKWVVEKTEYAAIQTACEAIQVAAMCQKFLEMDHA